MPKGPQGQKRPADAIGLAVMVGRIATGEIEDSPVPTKPVNYGDRFSCRRRRPPSRGFRLFESAGLPQQILHPPRPMQHTPDRDAVAFGERLVEDDVGTDHQAARAAVEL